MGNGLNPSGDDSRNHAFLAQVRRLEAVSFRSFPSTTTHYDGSWAIRLTGGHPAKRLNSVNPLDPRDYSHMDERLLQAQQRFDGFGRPLVFRQTPLAPSALDMLLDSKGWGRFEESIVMVAELGSISDGKPIMHKPVRSVGQWVDSFLKLTGGNQENKPGLVEVISNIVPNCGLFVNWQDGYPVSVLRCVQDNDLAGVFDVATGKEHRNKGYAKALVTSALHWAREAGARHAWLQVVADNEPAVGLYHEFGFRELYRYTYRIPPKTDETEGRA